MTSYPLSSSFNTAAASRPGSSLSRHSTMRVIWGAAFKYRESAGGSYRSSFPTPPSDSVFALCHSFPRCFSSVR